MKKLSFLLLILLPSNVLCYEAFVHKEITRHAIALSNVEQSLSNNLKISLADLFVDDAGKEWIINGSDWEDADPRYLNHFYDPTTGKGLNNLGLSGEPSLQWGKDSPNNVNSWKWARDAYYKALTDTNSNFRNTYFSYVFQDLGQIMHLVQDLAVPAHVRNDAHPYPPEWLCSNCLQDQRDMYEKYTKTANLTYDGYPAVDITTFNIFDDFWINGGKGLSEYTNSNFLSRDTNIDDKKYPLPVKIGYSTTTEHLYDPFYNWWTDVTVRYLQGYATDKYRPETSKPVSRLSAVSFFDFEMNRYFGKNVFSLNKFTHKEYADFLIPRAVGYSAGLLNYFFRGQMEATRVSGGLKVKNTGNEAMSFFTDPRTGEVIGSISIYYDDSYNPSQRRLIAIYSLTEPLAPGQETPVITFTEPYDNTKPGRYIVVFHGKLGEESGAVIGKITEPTQLYYASKRNGVYKIYKMDVDVSNETVVYDNQNPDINIGKLAPSPDGKKLAFTVQGPRIYLIDLTTGELKEVAKGEWPTWSPDGTKVAFQRETGQYLPNQADVEIFAIEPETGRETQLTNVRGASYSGQPSWSPDGSTIAYSRFDPEEEGCWNYYAVYLMDSTGNPKGPVTCEEMNYMDFSPSWSPYSKDITFTRRRENQFNQLYKVNIETKTITKLTDSTGSNYNELTPAWSTDGKLIAVGSNKDGDFDIWLVDPNGGGYTRNLTDSNSDIDGFPAFGQ